jgi:hypothetical protein
VIWGFINNLEELLFGMTPTDQPSVHLASGIRSSKKAFSLSPTGFLRAECDAFTCIGVPANCDRAHRRLSNSDGAQRSPPNRNSAECEDRCGQSSYC